MGDREICLAFRSMSLSIVELVKCEFGLPNHDFWSTWDHQLLMSNDLDVCLSIIGIKNKPQGNPAGKRTRGAKTKPEAVRKKKPKAH